MMLVQVQYVEIGAFITVGIAIFSLMITGFALMLKQLANLKDNIATQAKLLEGVKKENESDQRNIDGLWDTVKANIIKMETLERQRTGDVIQFTEVIGKLNTTLGKMEVTLENTNNVMQKVERRLEDQDREIKELKGK